MKFFNLISIFVLSILQACGSAKTNSSQLKEGWNAYNDPLLLSGNFDRNFSTLPLTGALPTVPWTDSYWPNYLGGVSQRWRNPPAPADQFGYKSPTKRQLSRMTLAQRSELSPAEKFDALVGRYDYPSVARERARVSPDNATWEGMCHGWAAASLNFKEPRPTAVTNADGISIPFGSSDIKALLSYYQGDISYTPSRMLGTRCDIDLVRYPNAAKDHPECKGINAGAFHVALTNLVGKEHVGVIADVSHGNEIWNQPIYAYSSKITQKQEPTEGAAADATSELVVHTDLSYTLEVDPNWNALNGTEDWTGVTVAYDYRVELNADGDVVGGSWINPNIPDFFWLQGAPRFEGYYGAIKAVYERSLVGRELPDPSIPL